MSWLKKLGQAVLKGIGIVQQFQPQIAANLPINAATKFNDIFGRIVSAVTTTEVVVGAISGGKTGADKLLAASALVGQIVQSSELMAGKKIHDEAAFTAAVQRITGGVADLMNSLDGDVVVNSSAGASCVLVQWNT